MNYNKPMPKYANDITYQKLVGMCELANRKVIYGKLSDETAAMTDKYFLILMPDDEAFETDEAAGKVIAHELGHCLYENPSSTFIKACENLMFSAAQYTDVKEFIFQCEEVLCDMASEFLYSLAEMIAMCDAEGSELMQPKYAKQEI